MNLLKGIAAPAIYIEIGHSSMKVVDGDDGLELSLERLESGRLAPACAERLVASLRIFLKKHLWRSRLRAICAIGAQGVSLRRLGLPGNPSDDELERLLPLQIEREFPLSPEELAWGYCKLGKQAGENGTEVLVAAVKKDIIEQYEEILNGCGVSATYILAATARGSLCSAIGAFSVLDIGRSHSELISFRNSLPEAMRVFSWGGENITRAIEKNFGVAHAEAEKSKISSVPPESSNGAPPRNLQAVIDEELDQFARSLPLDSVGHRLYLTGGGARLSQAGSRLAAALGGRAQCERIETFNGEGRSAAIVALSRSGGETPRSMLVLRPGLSRAQEKAPRPAALRWTILAAALLLGCLALRYTEPFLNKPRLIRQLADVKAYRETLPRIERELSFFEFIRTNQPAYLEPLFALANAAPSGTKIESISMNKRGDMALRASMKDPSQLMQLRSKLIESGLFTSVVVEEQTPSSDRQKLSVRMSAHFKPTEKAVEPAAASTSKPRSARNAAGTNPTAPTNAAPRPVNTPPSPQS